MKKTDRYCFPAVFSYEEGQEISVFFPDLDVATSGVNDDDALLSARELLARVNRSVNRTVTLPAWLNAAALERNVNFSQVLQDALKDLLGIGIVRN